MHRRMDAWLLGVMALATALAPTALPGGEIRLTDGTVLRGTIRPQQSLALSLSNQVTLHPSYMQSNMGVIPAHKPEVRNYNAF